jgi:ATP-dependent helicase/nuclease subunit A
MDTSAKLHIYSASAGSGKTYTLALEYIKLLLATTDAAYYRKILAVTFTNDAANEMKSRVLEFLEHIGSQNNKGQLLTSQILIQQKELNPAILALRAQQAYQHIIHNYADFSIQTIDSFVNRIIAAFAYPLGLSGSFEVVLDSQDLLIPAAESLLNSVGAALNPILTQNLIDFQIEKATTGKSWNSIQTDLVKFSEKLFSDKNIDPIAKIASIGEQSFINIRKKINTHIADNERITINKLKEIIELCENAGLSPDDFASKSSGLLGTLKKKINKNKLWEPFSESFMGFANAEKPLYTKATAKDYEKAQKNQTIEDLSPELLSMVQNFATWHQNSLQSNLLYANIAQKLTHLSLLKNIKNALENIKQNEGKIHISEFNQLVFNEIIDSPVPYIYERIGVRYQHIMIDEFQDTSNIQFQNFLALIDNCLATNGSCMLVGDPKQGIYGFRGGDYRQLTFLSNKKYKQITETFDYQYVTQQLLENISKNIAQHNLHTNYRSAAQIVAFNNDLFDFLRLHPSIKSQVPIFDAVYTTDLLQNLPNTQQSFGHVSIEFLEKNNETEETDTDENSPPDEFLQKLEQIIQNCQSQGYQYGQIAILCRYNKEAKLVAKHLSDKGLPVVSAQSVLLSFSGMVQLIEAFLELYWQPNINHKFNCISLIYKYLLQKPLPNTIPASSEILADASPEYFYQYLETLGFQTEPLKQKNTSVYDQCQAVISALDLFSYNQHDYIFGFLDFVLKFELSNGNNLALFMEEWKQRKDKLSIVTDSPNAIVVNSIHKAKGLQYPVVILAFAHWQLGLRYTESLWINTEQLSDNELITDSSTNTTLNPALINYSSKLTNHDLGNQLKDAENAAFIEAVNMLYVATTRAEQQLFILAKQTKVKADMDKKMNNISELLVLYLSEKYNYTASQSQYILHQGQYSSTTAKPATQSLGIAINRNIGRLTPVFKTNTSYQSHEINQGNMVHKVLSEIRYTTDLEAVANKYNLWAALEQNQNSLLHIIQNILKHPQLSAYFEPNTVAKNELEFISNGAEYRADRVVFYPESTIVIDYKTGNKEAGHQKQIENYTQILQNIGYPKPRGILVYLPHCEVIEL